MLFVKRWTPLLCEPLRIRTGIWPNWSACIGFSLSAPPFTGSTAPICSWSGWAPSLFDDGVGLARRLSRHDPVEGPRTLARILIDRSSFRTAAGGFRAALDDFRQALSHLGEAN